MNKNNFYIYFARLCRHFILTKEETDIITFLDLTHSFRCLIDISKEIDLFLKREGYICNFKYLCNLKELKKSSLDGLTIFDIISAEQGIDSNTGFIKRALSIEELDNYKPTTPKYSIRPMDFTNWLDCELASISENDITITISRSLFIKRIANKFSGSHPFESEDYTEKNPNKKLAYSYIDQFQCIQISSYNYGYVLVQKFAEELILAVIDFLLIDKTNVGYDIFLKCKEILEHKK